MSLASSTSTIELREVELDAIGAYGIVSANGIPSLISRNVIASTLPLFGSTLKSLLGNLCNANLRWRRDSGIKRRGLRRRLVRGRSECGEAIATLRTFVGPTQAGFARAIGISVRRIWRARLGARAMRVSRMTGRTVSGGPPSLVCAHPRAI